MSASIAYYGGIVTSGLVLYLDAAKRDSYPGTGTVWNSVARGNQLTGSLVNGVTYNQDSGSLQFDGVNDYVVLTSSFLNLPSNYTICGWFKFQVVIPNYGYGILDWGEGVPYKRRSMLIWNGGSGTSYYVVASFYDSNVLGTTNINDGKLHFGCVSFDGSVANVYTDGMLEKSQSPTTSAYTYTNHYIGNTHYGLGEYFKSDIFNVYLYNKVLSPSEVLQNYNAQKGRFGLT